MSKAICNNSNKIVQTNNAAKYRFDAAAKKSNKLLDEEQSIDTFFSESKEVKKKLKLKKKYFSNFDFFN